MDEIYRIEFSAQTGSTYGWIVGEIHEELGELMIIKATKRKDDLYDIEAYFLTSKNEIKLIHPSCKVEAIYYKKLI